MVMNKHTGYDFALTVILIVCIKMIEKAKEKLLNFRLIKKEKKQASWSMWDYSFLNNMVQAYRSISNGVIKAVSKDIKLGWMNIKSAVIFCEEI